MLLRRFAIGFVFVLGGLASMATSPNEEDFCETDADLQRCDGSCEDFAAALREPRASPAFTAARCTRVDRVGCGCFVDDGRELDILAGDAFVSDESCSVFGRLGDCLFEPSDFPGCTIGDEASDAICADICATVAERRQADAAARPDVSVDDAVCDFDCACRIRDGERCVLVEGVEPYEGEIDRSLRFSACAVAE